MSSKEDDDDRRGGAGKCQDDEDGGKLDESTDGRNGDDTTILDRVLELMLSSGMEHDFEDFAKAHHDAFTEAAEAKDEESVEYTLEHTNIFNKYLAVFEKKVSDFIEGEGFTLEQFYAQCRRVLERNRDDDPRKYFIEALLATTEFHVFFQLMLNEAIVRKMADKQAKLSLSSEEGGKK